MVSRISTHVPGLDKLIQGGLPKGSITLISGTPGTGKSILSSQVAYNNALKGKKCLYLNLEQNEGRLENQMKQFGWDEKKVSKYLKVIAVDSSNPKLVDYLLKEIQNAKYDLIILDSLDSISSNPLSVEEMSENKIDKIAQFTIPTLMDSQTIGRMKLKKIFSAIAKTGATALLTSERVEGANGISRDTISEFLCDGIIMLKSTRVGSEFSRNIHVEKMRGTKIDPILHTFEFKKNGINVQ